MDYDLKYLILGYRKYTKTTQKELADKLDIPLDIETALEWDYKQPSKQLRDKIKELTAEYDQDILRQIGRGFRIKDELGPDYKYFLRGLKIEKDIDPQKLKDMSSAECLRTIGSVDLDEFDVVEVGREA